MKKKSSTTLVLKSSIIIVCFLTGISVKAQTLTGKWKLTNAKETVTDKASGKTQDIGAQMQEFLKMMQEIIVFNADKTYFVSNRMAGAKSGLEVSGTYSVSGNQLKLNEGKSNMPKIDKKYTSNSMNKLLNTVTIVSQTGNTLVLRYGAETTSDGKTFTVNIEDTFTRQ